MEPVTPNLDDDEFAATQPEEKPKWSRISVYVGAELVDRLAPFKEKLNLSKVAQEALEAKVAQLEWEAGVGDRKAQIVQRLRQALSPMDRARREGYNEGRRWAESDGSWTDIKDVLTWSQVKGALEFYEDEPYVSLQVDGKVLQLPEKAGSPDSLLEREYRLNPQANEKFIVGFVTGVREIHDLVRAEMEPGTQDIDPDDIPF